MQVIYNNVVSGILVYKTLVFTTSSTWQVITITICFPRQRTVQLRASNAVIVKYFSLSKLLITEIRLNMARSYLAQFSTSSLLLSITLFRMFTTKLRFALSSIASPTMSTTHPILPSFLWMAVRSSSLKGPKNLTSMPCLKVYTSDERTTTYMYYN